MRGVYGHARSARPHAVFGVSVGDARAPARVPLVTARGDATGRVALYAGPRIFHTGPAYYVDAGASSYWLFNDDGTAASRQQDSWSLPRQPAPEGTVVITLGDHLPGLLELGRQPSERFYLLPASIQPRVTVGAEAADSTSLVPGGMRGLWEQAKVGVVLSLSAVAVIMTAKVLSPDDSRR